jgi:hypothetical protein
MPTVDSRLESRAQRRTRVETGRPSLGDMHHGFPDISRLLCGRRSNHRYVRASRASPNSRPGSPVIHRNMLESIELEPAEFLEHRIEITGNRSEIA